MCTLKATFPLKNSTCNVRTIIKDWLKIELRKYKNKITLKKIFMTYDFDDTQKPEHMLGHPLLNTVRFSPQANNSDFIRAIFSYLPSVVS